MERGREGKETRRNENGKGKKEGTEGICEGKGREWEGSGMG